MHKVVIHKLPIGQDSKYQSLPQNQHYRATQSLTQRGPKTNFDPAFFGEYQYKMSQISREAEERNFRSQFQPKQANHISVRAPWERRTFSRPDNKIHQNIDSSVAYGIKQNDNLKCMSNKQYNHFYPNRNLNQKNNILNNVQQKNKVILPKLTESLDNSRINQDVQFQNQILYRNFNSSSVLESGRHHNSQQSSQQSPMKSRRKTSVDELTNEQKEELQRRRYEREQKRLEEKEKKLQELQQRQKDAEEQRKKFEEQLKKRKEEDNKKKKEENEQKAILLEQKRKEQALKNKQDLEERERKKQQQDQRRREEAERLKKEEEERKRQNMQKKKEQEDKIKQQQDEKKRKQDEQKKLKEQQEKEKQDRIQKQKELEKHQQNEKGGMLFTMHQLANVPKMENKSVAVDIFFMSKTGLVVDRLKHPINIESDDVYQEENGNINLHLETKIYVNPYQLIKKNKQDAKLHNIVVALVIEDDDVEEGEEVSEELGWFALRMCDDKGEFRAGNFKEKIFESPIQEVMPVDYSKVKRQNSVLHYALQYTILDQ